MQWAKKEPPVPTAVIVRDKTGQPFTSECHLELTSVTALNPVVGQLRMNRWEICDWLIYKSSLIPSYYTPVFRYHANGIDLSVVFVETLYGA